MNSKDIVALLRRHYAGNGWVFFEQLRLGTGWRNVTNPTVEQTIDGWAMNTWASKKLVRLAFEIKVTHSDFLREIKNPDKRVGAMAVSQAFYFVCPRGIIMPSEVPADCGLIWTDGEALATVIEAPWHECEPPSWRFIASIARRVQREQTTKSKARTR